MKYYIGIINVTLVVALCLLVSLKVWAFDLSSGSSSRRLSTTEEFLGKRYLGDKQHAKEKYQENVEKATKDLLRQETPDTLSKEEWETFYKRYVMPCYVQTPEGDIVQVACWEYDGKCKQVRPYSEECKQVSVEDFLKVCPKGKEFYFPTVQTIECRMCDGQQYVLYFTEEVQATRRYQGRYHKSHAGTDLEHELASQAYDYGWYRLWASSPYYLHSCCWTKIHKSSASALRHPCPICKGKKIERIKRLKAVQIGFSIPKVTTPIKGRFIPITTTNIGEAVGMPPESEDTLGSAITREPEESLDTTDVENKQKTKVVISHRTPPHKVIKNFWLTYPLGLSTFTYKGSLMLGEKYGCVLSIGSELDSLQLWRSKEANTLEIRSGRNRIEKKIKLEDVDTSFHFYTIEVTPNFITIAVDEKEVERLEPNPIALPLYGLQYNKPLGKNPKSSHGAGRVKAWGILVNE